MLDLTTLHTIIAKQDHAQHPRAGLGNDDLDTGGYTTVVVKEEDVNGI